MIFSEIRRRRAVKSNAAALYRQIASQSRQPEFYRDLGVPDTIDGRFDLVLLHTFLVLRRLKIEGGAGEALRQALFDAMFMSLDDSLRHMGVGDLSVGKKIKKMSSAFYGRVDAYDGPMVAGDRDGLAEAIRRNLYRENPAEEASALQVADYMIAAWKNLKGQGFERYSLGLVDFITVPAVIKESAIRESAGDI